MSTSKLDLQQNQRINYNKAKEPRFDEYIFCDACEDYVYEYCSLHGPLLVITDDKVPDKSSDNVPQAALSVPHEFLHFASSTIPGAGIGVFTTLTLPRGVQFGPYRGQQSKKIDSLYCWQIYDAKRRRKHVVDAADPDRSNWMRYVNCSRHWAEQNLLAFQYQGEVYYRTIRTIPRYTELLVFYGTGFAHCLGVDLKHYNTPNPILPDICDAKPQYNHVSEILKVKEETDKFEPSHSGQNSEDIVSTPQTICSMEIEKESSRAIFFQEESQSTLHLSPFEENSSIKSDSDKTVICDQCDKPFDSKHGLIEHLRTHFETNLIPKPEPKYEEPMLTRDPLTRLYRCPSCSYQLKDRSRFMTRHWLPRHLGKKFPCPICGSEFSFNNDLKRHLKKHRDNKYTCTLCSKSFIQNYLLKRHVISFHGDSEISILSRKNEIHNNKKCELCNKVFRDSYSLKRHLNTHLNFNKYKCPICGKGFKENDKLKKHLKVHDRGVTFYCLLCPLIFRSQGNLNTHLETHKVHEPIA